MSILCIERCSSNRLTRLCAITREQPNSFAVRFIHGTVVTCQKHSYAHFDVHVALVMYTSRTYLLIFDVLTQRTPKYRLYIDVAHSIGVQNGFLHFFLFTGTDFWFSGHFFFVLKLEVYVCLVVSLLILSFLIITTVKGEPKNSIFGSKTSVTL